MILESSVVKVGKMTIGGNNAIIVQSMTNTSTLNTKATVEQIKSLYNAGCQIIRLSVKDVKEAENLKNIKAGLNKLKIDIPLVADIHFNPKLAEVAARIVEKVRINPGNYVDKNRDKTSFSNEEDKKEIQNISLRLKPLLEICKKHNTAIRIGTNHGSLSERILFKYGNTAEGMVNSALEFVEICRNQNFHNIILSMKSSHVPTMIAANKLLVTKMQNRGYFYPIHLGVTEAGNGEDARIKSAAGIASLLAENIGDTIRVSLTEKPENEIPFAKKLIEKYGLRTAVEMPVNQGVTTKPQEYYLNYKNLNSEQLLISASVDFTRLHLHKPAKLLRVANNKIENKTLANNILQALGIKYSKAEFIACPSCGRTLFDIEVELEKVRLKTFHLKGVKIAVMGCFVNALGEMADADYGYVGSGFEKVSLYKGKQLIKKNIPVNNAVSELVEIIKKNNDWK
jgi:(E)-4-hydroxy-3-methylbut-2-enyl-diphosphate synthase